MKPVILPFLLQSVDPEPERAARGGGVRVAGVGHRAVGPEPRQRHRSRARRLRVRLQGDIGGPCTMVLHVLRAILIL